MVSLLPLRSKIIFNCTRWYIKEWHNLFTVLFVMSHPAYFNIFLLLLYCRFYYIGLNPTVSAAFSCLFRSFSKRVDLPWYVVRQRFVEICSRSKICAIMQIFIKVWFQIFLATLYNFFWFLVNFFVIPTWYFILLLIFL